MLESHLIGHRVRRCFHFDDSLRCKFLAVRIAELLVRSRTESWSDFSAVEQQRITTLWFLIVDRLELQFRLFSRNNDELDPDSIVFPQNLLSLQMFLDWWSRNKQVYHPDFVTFFDELIAANQS